jgi:hypothetical protein
MELDSYLSEKQRRRKKRQRYLYVALAAAAVYLLLAGTAWAFLRNPFLRVDNVTVTGNDTVPTGDVIAIVQSAALRDRGLLLWKAILGYRNMLIWPSSLTAADLIFNPRLQAVTLSKDYFSHTITVHVTERTPLGTWCFMPQGAASGATAASENCYWFDDTGFMFARTLDTQGNLIFVVHDYSQTGRGLAQEILPDEFVPNFISIIDALKASGIGVSDIVLKDISLEEIDVTTQNGPALYFSLRFSADEDLPVLEDLMTKSDFSKLQYVDFRVENRAYYK